MDSHQHYPSSFSYTRWSSCNCTGLLGCQVASVDSWYYVHNPTHAMLRLREWSVPADFKFDEWSAPATLLGSESLFSRSLKDSVVPVFSFFTPVNDGTDLLNPLTPFAFGELLTGVFPLPLAAILFCLSNLSLSSRFICSSSWKLKSFYKSEYTDGTATNFRTETNNGTILHKLGSVNMCSFLFWILLTFKQRQTDQIRLPFWEENSPVNFIFYFHQTNLGVQFIPYLHSGG